ncbi:MAG: substrate-binding domain-containing protein [bacterium]
MKFLKSILITALLAGLSVTAYAAPTSQDLGSKWCKDVRIHFFAGGAEGDGFAGIVQAGAENAIRDTGADAEILYSEWQSDRMIQQLREAIGAGVDGIAMMGHPGEEAIMPLAQVANEEGILMMYQNVDVPAVRAKFGGGYVGANLATQGYMLGQEAIRRFDLKKGDKAVVMVPIGDYSRAQREDNVRIAFEEHGMEVVVLDGTPEYATDPNSAIPVISAALAANSDAKILVHTGGQMLGNAETFAVAAGYGPNELLQIGFDTSPQVMSGFVNGFVHLTSDQQPFLQGYLPVLSLCQMKVMGLGALNQDTGAGFVTTENYESVMSLANAGLR